LRLERHLERMKDSARTLGFEFDRHGVRNQLHAVTFHLDAAAKIRLLLSRSGAIAIEIGDAPTDCAQPWMVKIVPMTVDASDFRLSHKTSDRAFYDEPRKMHKDIDEVLFINADGYLTEGSITALFVERNGIMLTPHVSHGLLPSVLRTELIAEGRAEEADIRVEDLADGFLLGNSVRGLFAAQMIL
jgi:para-aminobenzoate synthetase / 4-amino-4-deoxychorismate lyase